MTTNMAVVPDSGSSAEVADTHRDAAGPVLAEHWQARHIVFDGPPSHDGPRFIEVETPDGKSVNAGEWRERPDGYWELVILAPAVNLVGAAENEVGRAVYERIEALMGAVTGTPEAAELAYLSHLAESVEEVGGYDGPQPPVSPAEQVGEDAIEGAEWWWDALDPDCGDSDAPVNILTQHYAEGEVAEVVGACQVARRYGFWTENHDSSDRIAHWFKTRDEAEKAASVLPTPPADRGVG